MTGDSSSLPNGPSSGTIDIAKYVSQLEKRLSEQEVLISLLREKLFVYESNAPSLSNPGTVDSAGQGARGSGSSYANVVRNGVDSSVFTGSRKSDIAAVKTTKLAQFFITRINPIVSAAVLAQDLMAYVRDLKSVKCCKIKTKYLSYSSFHLVVPEDQKNLVCSGEVWPEGVLVKPFVGKLKNDYILERYDSLHPDGDSSETDNGNGPSNVTSTPDKTVPPPKRNNINRTTKVGNQASKVQNSVNSISNNDSNTSSSSKSQTPLNDSSKNLQRTTRSTLGR